MRRDDEVDLNKSWGAMAVDAVLLAGRMVLIALACLLGAVAGLLRWVVGLPMRAVRFFEPWRGDDER